MTRATICATITLRAFEVYARHSARREGSSMVSAAILFFDEHGPASKTSLHTIVHQREKSIAFLQDIIRELTEKLDALIDED